MRIEIDQSCKIEEVGDTIIAFSNKEQFTVLIPKPLKDILLKRFKRTRKGVYKIFALGVYNCIKEYLDKDKQIIIDDEYRKHGRDIKTFLLDCIRRDRPLFNGKLIMTKSLSKKSKAHKLAYKTFIGKLKPNKILTEKDFK